MFLSYINSVTIPTFIIPGNHEATKKGESFFEHFTQENAIKNENVTVFTRNGRASVGQANFCFFPYGEMQKNNLPEYVGGDILVTHIRGEVPPHVSPEYDFSRLAPWRLCLLGDLHFNHRYGNTNCYYPGSPLNTTFDRDENRQYGVDIYDFINDKDYRREFVDLELPKLIRKRVTAGEAMLEDKINHVVYEVTGSIDELSRIENTELLDKKIAAGPTEDSKLDLKNKTVHEELEIYLEYIKIKDKQSVVDEFKGLNINV